MTEPLTAEQIAACHAVLDVLAPTSRDPWSAAIHERALRRARAAAVLRQKTGESPITEGTE